MLLLAACATVSEDVAPPPSAAAPDYVPDAGYHMLMGEIALQRGDYHVTAQEYLAATRLSQDVEMAQRATEYAYEYGFQSYFFASATRWVQLDPESRAAQGFLGVGYLRRNDAQAAFEHFDRSMPPERTEGDYLVLQREMSAAGGEPQAVIDVLQLFLEKYPNRPGLQLGLAYAAARANQGELTVANADAVLVAEPGMREAELLRVRGLMISGLEEEGLNELASLIELEGDVELELEYARLLAGSGDVEQSLAYLADMSERYGFVPEIVRLQGLIRLSEDDQAEAWNDFNKLLAANVYTNESNFYLAEMSEGSREYLQALRYYSQVRSGSLLLPAQIAVAEVLGTVGDLDAGIAHLDDVYAQFPQLGYDIWTAKAGLYAKYWRSAESYEAYNRSLEYQPDNISLMLGRAAALDLMGETDRAITAFRQVLEIDPGNPNGMNSLGYTLANRDRKLREARRLVDKALQQQPDNPAFLDSMGWVLFREGKSAEALDYLERAYDIDGDPEIAAHLGEVLWSLGRDGEANIVWALALQSYPRHQVLLETIERFTS